MASTNRFGPPKVTLERSPDDEQFLRDAFRVRDVNRLEVESRDVNATRRGKRKLAGQKDELIIEESPAAHDDTKVTPRRAHDAFARASSEYKLVRL